EYDADQFLHKGLPSFQSQACGAGRFFSFGPALIGQALIDTHPRKEWQFTEKKRPEKLFALFGTRPDRVTAGFTQGTQFTA
ncbi:MAG: hypothetical protein IJL88_03585, partial [Clostridia bacterium]|nr:hypothetical protein [Clostridia bacterium]